MSKQASAYVCTKCRQEKPAGMFYERAKSRTGRASSCKACHSAQLKARYATAYGDIARAKMKAVYAAKREHRCANARAYKDAHRDEINVRQRARYAANRERLKAQNNEASRRRTRERPDDVRAYRRTWLAANPHQRLSHRIGTSVRQALAADKSGRRWEVLVGYTLGELKTHIERQFAPGMTWENCGDWHVDHILPIASFRFTSAEDPEFKACWAITNLQPLWAAQNLSKKATRTTLL